MANVTASSIIIGILLFVGLASGSFIMIGSFIQSDDSARYAEYNSSFTKLTDVRANAEEIKTGIETANPSSGILGILNGLVESSWGSIKLIWSSIDTMTTILGDISEHLFIDTWLIVTITSIIFIAIVFALMAAWFKWNI